MSKSKNPLIDDGENAETNETAEGGQAAAAETEEKAETRGRKKGTIAQATEVLNAKIEAVAAATKLPSATIAGFVSDDLAAYANALDVKAVTKARLDAALGA